MKTNVLRSVMLCCMFFVTTAVSFAEGFKLNNEFLKVNDVYQYGKTFAQAAGMGGSPRSYAVADNFFAAGIGYWDHEYFETYGIQMTSLRYNGWASEMNIRWHFEDNVAGGGVDMAILGYSFGLSEFDNGALYLALVGGPTLRFQNETNYKNDEEEMKIYFDAYVSASLNFQIGEHFLLKAGYYFWAPEFDFGEEYRVDGFYASFGFSF